MNLLLDSKKSLSGKTYDIGYWTASRDFVPGEKLTVTIKGNPRVTGTLNFGIWFNTSSLNASQNIPNVATGIYSQEITVPTGTTTRQIGIYLVNNQTAGQSWTFEWIKLEVGNKVSYDWTPAPGDVDAAISSLSITGNKITLSSKTIELKGSTIAGAIEAEDLKVGSRTGLSALEVLKNGTFYAKGSTASNSSLIIDSSAQSIEIISPNSANGNSPIGNNSPDNTGKSTVLISSQSGGVRVSNDSYNASIVSTNGIFANNAGQAMFDASTGLQSKAAIVGLGFGNVAVGLGNDFVAGIYGRATNNGTGEAYGGYFDILKANGLYAGCKRITATITLTKNDVFVSCYNTVAITISLPTNPYPGQIIMIRRNNTATVLANGNGKSIMNTGIASTIYVGQSQGDIGLFVFDGQYWTYNYIPRNP